MFPRLAPPLLAVALAAAACSSSTSAEPNTEPSTTATTASTGTTVASPSTTDAAAIELPQGCAGLPTGANSEVLTAGGADHPVRIYVPSGFSGEPVAAVLNWHGLGADGLQQAALSSYETLAEDQGFIAVHPTGVPGPGDNRNSWELIDDQDPNRDDLEFADTLIDWLVESWCVDSDRVYSTGFSNGGFFTARLVCERSERIAAAVSVAATTHQPDCDPARPVPYSAYHGTADQVVPFDDSTTSVLLADPANDSALGMSLSDLLAESISDEFGEFAAAAACATDPIVEQIGDDVVAYRYDSCFDGAERTLYEVIDGGHTWPGSPLAPLLGDFLGRTTTTVSASADGWLFMSRFSLE